MAHREWTELDEEMALQGAFETKSRKQVLHRPLGRGPAKAKRGQRRGENKVANIVAKRCEG